MSQSSRTHRRGGGITNRGRGKESWPQFPDKVKSTKGTFNSADLFAPISARVKGGVLSAISAEKSLLDCKTRPFQEYNKRNENNAVIKHNNQIENEKCEVFPLTKESSSFIHNNAIRNHVSRKEALKTIYAKECIGFPQKPILLEPLHQRISRTVFAPRHKTCGGYGKEIGPSTVSYELPNCFKVPETIAHIEKPCKGTFTDIKYPIVPKSKGYTATSPEMPNGFVIESVNEFWKEYKERNPRKQNPKHRIFHVGKQNLPEPMENTIPSIPFRTTLLG